MFRVILFVTSSGKWKCNDMRIRVWEAIALNRIFSACRFRQLLLKNYLKICQVNYKRKAPMY